MLFIIVLSIILLLLLFWSIAAPLNFHLVQVMQKHTAGPHSEYTRTSFLSIADKNAWTWTL